jgi:hypothetical protein
MYGLLRFLNWYNMKTLRIVNCSNRCVYVERRVLRFFWRRVSPKFVTNIEAWNWVRSQGDYRLLTKR